LSYFWPGLSDGQPSVNTHLFPLTVLQSASTHLYKLKREKEWEEK